jgi:TatD family-associated radical SAM protein
VFCVRNNHDSINDVDVLWLDGDEPTLEDIKKDFAARDMKKYSSVTFCGFGEPLMRFDVCMETAKWLKKTYPGIKIKINTNGQANLIEKKDVTPGFKGLVDIISISLNAPDAKKYDKMCQSVFGESAFNALIDFAKKAGRYVPDVVMSVVNHDLTKEEIEECKRIAEDCGATLRIREYIE